MTFLIYIMLVKIYCEMIGSCEYLGVYMLMGFIMWSGHCIVKYLCK